MTSNALIILGSGTPTPTQLRFGTSYLLQLGEHYVMIDCGPATTYKLVKAGVYPTQIDHLLFTHHHFDHNSDYPCFLLCRWDQSTGVERLLEVHGPTPTEWITERLIGEDGAFACDWRARIEAPVSQRVHVNRGGSLPRPKPCFHVRDVIPGEVIECDGYRVTTARSEHVQPWLESLAYRIEGNGATITFAGDTQMCQSIVDLAHGVDALVVNCWDHQSDMGESGEAAGQTGTIDAARMAQESGASRLILTHTGPHLSEPGSRERAIEDISRIYSGEIVFGEELMRIEL
jgi:ribonuclease Z